MKTRTNVLTSLTAAIVMIGCADAPAPEPAVDQDQSAAAADIPGWVTDLAAVARAIEEAPNSADSILAAAEMSRARFDSLVYEVAADPALTAAFEAARR